MIDSPPTAVGEEAYDRVRDALSRATKHDTIVSPGFLVPSGGCEFAVAFSDEGATEPRTVFLRAKSSDAADTIIGGLLEICRDYRRKLILTHTREQFVEFVTSAWPAYRFSPSVREEIKRLDEFDEASPTGRPN